MIDLGHIWCESFPYGEDVTVSSGEVWVGELWAWFWAACLAQVGLREVQLVSLSCGGIWCVAVVIIIRTDFLHQFIVDAVKGDVDAYDLKWFRAQP